LWRDLTTAQVKKTKGCAMSMDKACGNDEYTRLETLTSGKWGA